MKKFLKSVQKGIVIGLYCTIAITVTALSGCQYLTPTRVPPLSEELGYEVPDWKGWTLVGLNEASYKFAYEKLKLYRVMVNIVNEPALQAREQVINWGNIALSAGAFGGIPLALRKVPKGYVKKEPA